MKNVDKIYENYYDASKSDYDTDNELNEAKKKNIGYRKFELGNKNR